MKPDDSPYRYKYLDGEIQLRGDKSISHRILLLSSIASASVKIHNLSLGQDVQATLNALKKIGVKTVGDIKSELIINPMEVGSKPSRVVSIDCGNSGTTARLLIGFLSGLGIEARLYGDESLSQRPMKRVTEPLVSMGGNYLYNKGDCLPLKVLNNNGMHGISYLMPVPSAQVKTSILLAALFSDSKTKILEKNKTRDHTERMLELAGVDIQCDGNRIELNPMVSPLNLPVEYLVPGDISTAAFFIAGALLLPGSEITVKNSLLNKFRTGFLQHFKKMGAAIQVLNSHTSYNETVGDIYVHFKGALESIEILPEDIASCIDEIPSIALVSSRCRGTTYIKGLSELRIKESDRINSIEKNLNSLGINTRSEGDNLIIKGKPLVTYNQKEIKSLDAYSDHRIAMMNEIAYMIVNYSGDCKKDSIINISAGEFQDVLEKIKKDRLRKNVYLIGFMGAGKSMVGKMLAKNLGFSFIDTDVVVRENAGKPIPRIFKEDGEQRFREMEREVVQEIIKLSRKVIATGGGIPCSNSNMLDIFRDGIVISLHAEPDELFERIKNSSGRPLLKDFQYFNELFSRRERNYSSADLIISTTDKEISLIIEEISEYLVKEHSIPVVTGH